MKLIAAHIDGRVYKISEYKGGLRSSFCFFNILSLYLRKIFYQMFQKIYNILVSILGESKQGGYMKGCSQYQFNCIMDCAEEKGGPDGKYNLEVSFAIGKYHCWACDGKGNLSYLIRRYGGKEKFKIYEEEIKSIRESKMYDLSSYMDEIYGNTDKNGKTLKLPETYTKIDISSLKSKKLKNYLEKRQITQDIVDRFNIGYTQWDGETWTMRNRIVIPSYDEYGFLNYWVSRDFSGYEKKTKYKNCDADKKEIVFQESLINFDADIVLVEGALDCIYYNNAISMLGKFLLKDSELYKKLYSKANADIIICLDSDTTIEETKRIYNLLNVGRLRGRIKYIELNEYKDFGEVYEALGKKGIIETIKSAKKFDEIDLLI